MNLETITRIPEKQIHKTPLLFVHGMWHGAWCWDEFFLPYFAEHGWHVTALSLRGHSGSEGKIRENKIMDYVHDVEQAAGQFEAPPVLIGHSMGGFRHAEISRTKSRARRGSAGICPAVWVVELARAGAQI